MRIIINYDSNWQNSVLTGSNDEPVSKSNPREFKASSKSKEPEDIKDISDNTILGLLSRMIGDQRKLYQAKESQNFYFQDMEIDWKYIGNHQQWIEKAFLINKKENRPPQGSFIGVLDENEPLFFSEYSSKLWAILDLDFDNLLNFILNPSVKQVENKVSPTYILNRVQFYLQNMEAIQFHEDKIALVQDKLNKENGKENSSDKKLDSLKQELELLAIEANRPEVIEFEKKLKKCLAILTETFPDESYIENNRSILPIRFYSASLYLMLIHFQKNNIDTSMFLSSRGTLKGFSKRNFNGVRDFLNSLMGDKKKTTHTPYNLTKASGQLEITLNIDLDKAQDLLQKIENAGVSSFYLGKKGLAYVSAIYLPRPKGN